MTDSVCFQPQIIYCDLCLLLSRSLSLFLCLYSLLLLSLPCRHLFSLLSPSCLSYTHLPFPFFSLLSSRLLISPLPFYPPLSPFTSLPLSYTHPLFAFLLFFCPLPSYFSVILFSHLPTLLVFLLTWSHVQSHLFSFAFLSCLLSSFLLIFSPFLCYPFSSFFFYPSCPSHFVCHLICLLIYYSFSPLFSTTNLLFFPLCSSLPVTLGSTVLSATTYFAVTTLQTQTNLL